VWIGFVSEIDNLTAPERRECDIAIVARTTFELRWLGQGGPVKRPVQIPTYGNS
jgi:hypothetical protein